VSSSEARWRRTSFLSVNPHRRLSRFRASDWLRGDYPEIAFCSNRRPSDGSFVNEWFALLTGQSVLVPKCARMGHEMRSPVLFTHCDPEHPDRKCSIRLSLLRSVLTRDPMHPRRTVTLAPSLSAGTPTGLSGTTHGRQKMTTPAQREERKIGRKNNTSCVSPAPILHFTIPRL
jgi:hypothetical protein